MNRDDPAERRSADTGDPVSPATPPSLTPDTPSVSPLGVAAPDEEGRNGGGIGAGQHCVNLEVRRTDTEDVVSKAVGDEDHKPRGSLISYGSLCLDFLQALALSVGDQGSGQDLSRWIFERGLTERPAPVLTHVLPEVTALREAIWVSVRAAMAQGQFPEAERDRINRWASVHAYPQLEQTGDLTWHAHRPLEGALVRIARDAVELLSGETRSRIRRCPGCGALFLDRSPSGRATWCSMATCGNRAKVAAYRSRTRAIRGRRGSGRRD